MPTTRFSGRSNRKNSARPSSAMTITHSGTINPDPTITQHSRSTATHVFFWGGILSNWCMTSPQFSGATCLAIMMPKLDQLKIAHPQPDALSTQILAAHQFICGEQWMMAVKAWLFERESRLGEMTVDQNRPTSSETVIGRDRFNVLRNAVGQVDAPKDLLPDAEQRNLYDGTLYAILRASTPRAQKALGRQVGGFDGAVWDRASKAIVVASCIARAEVDPELRSVYQAGVTKAFVEGSPLDKIWGVGLKWDNPLIEKESNWRGQNRLGQCHDEAARHITEKLTS